MNYIVEKRNNEAMELSEKINHDNLAYHYRSKNIAGKIFNNFDNAFIFLKNMKFGYIAMEKAKHDQN